MRRVASGCDRVGFVLKHEIMTHLAEHDVEVTDKGTWSLERTGYLHYASQVALVVVGGEAGGGILICGTGVGISIAASKFTGIRAVVCNRPYSARLLRQHNDTSVLAFGSRVAGLEPARMIIGVWLSAQHEGGHHRQRAEAVTTIEWQRNRDSSAICMDK